MYLKKFCDVILAIFAINLHCAVFGGKVKVIELTTGWSLRNQNGSIHAYVGKIPSGVYTALKDTYGDVLYSYNDINLRWIAYDNWTYCNTFSVSDQDLNQSTFVNLTLYGVDTVAYIRLNNISIAKMDNMFARSSFNIRPYLREENILEIEIISPIYATKERAALLRSKNTPAPPECPFEEFKGECHRNLIRKMQASFGADCSLAAPSMGIWKTVELEFYEAAIMRDVDVALNKNETHWILDVRAFLTTDLKEKFYAELTFFAPGLLDQTVNISRRLVSYKKPVIEFKHEIPVKKVELWWPNGYGAQKLYPLFFSANCWQTAGGPALRANTVSQKSIKIGFRTIELVEDDMDGGGKTFFFKVNDVEIFAKGANILPMHILPELTNDIDKITFLLSSAKEAHMNMLRIWGGGLYESDHFYNLADYYGILVWQDMPFTSSTYPILDDFLEAVRLETVHNAKRLAYHPSLALFVTNDEVEMDLFSNKYDTDLEFDRYHNEFRQLFIGTILFELNIISRPEFRPRPGPLISTPSNGMEKKELTTKPWDPDYGDVHYYDDDHDSWNPDIYARPRFVSEYGFQSLPSVTAWERVRNSSDDLFELIAHRQHHENDSASVESQVRRHLPLPAKDDEDFLEAFVYMSQISQAMSTKVATEVFRSARYTERRTMGALFWQLNDVWIAPTRSMIDFFGNYKLLYYWARQFLAPTTIVALYDSKNKALNVTLINDDVSIDAESFAITMKIYLWSSLFSKKSTSLQSELRGNNAIAKILPMDSIFSEGITVKNSFLEFTLSTKQKIVSRSYFLPGNLTQIEGIKVPQLKYEITFSYCNIDKNNDQISYTITIYIKYPAAFVYLDINHPDVKQYKLSENGFIQVEPVKTVHLQISHSTQCVKITKDNVKIKTLNQYLTH